MKPLIGITAGTIYNRDFPKSPFTYGQGHTYVEAVRRAGGIPVIIPVTESPEAAKDIFDRIDAILFAGGNDVSPDLYHEKIRHATLIDATRDAHEVALMQLALDARKPILAICRGMQLLNVVRGGTLFQDILTEIPGAGHHDGYVEEAPQPLIHTLSVVPESELAKVLGTTTLRSNSFHHQAVKNVGKGLTVNAHAEDGVIEGIEDMSENFILAVQLHPESLVAEVEPAWRPLFSAFIDAARS